MARSIIVQFPMENLQFGWFLVPIRPEGLARALELAPVPFPVGQGPERRKGRKRRGH